MERPIVPPTATTLALAALAGFIDALVVSTLGLFASAGGNSTRLGVALAGDVAGTGEVAGALLLAFVAGVVAAVVAGRMSGARRAAATLALAAILLAVAAAIGGVAPDRLALLLAAAAAGAVNLVLTRGGGAGMTAALVALGERLADALTGEGAGFGWLPWLALWGGFVAGAVMGAGAYLRIGLAGLWVAAGVATVLAILTWAVRTDAP